MKTASTYYCPECKVKSLGEECRNTLCFVGVCNRQREELATLQRQLAEQTTHMHRMLALVGRALEGEHVSAEFGGNAPEDIQGLLDQAFDVHRQLAEAREDLYHVIRHSNCYCDGCNRISSKHPEWTEQLDGPTGRRVETDLLKFQLAEARAEAERLRSGIERIISAMLIACGIMTPGLQALEQLLQPPAGEPSEGEEEG